MSFSCGNNDIMQVFDIHVKPTKKLRKQTEYAKALADVETKWERVDDNIKEYTAKRLFSAYLVQKY